MRKPWFLAIAAIVHNVACVADWTVPETAGGAGGAAATVGIVSSVSTSSVGSGGSGGGSADCWSLDPTQWAIDGFDATALNGDMVADPMISPDALTLTYSAVDPAGLRRIYQAVRAARSAPFQGGTRIAAWPSVGDVGQPWAATDGEMWFSFNGDIARSILSGGTWQDPITEAALSSPATDATPALTGAATELFFERNDGPTDPVVGPVWRFYHAYRSAPASPGAAFGPVSALALAPTKDTDLLICPKPSPDGKHLFFATNYPDTVTAANVDHIMKIYYAERPDAKPETPWGTAIHISQFDYDMDEVCPMAISADGCEIWIAHFGTAFQTLIAHRVAP